MDDKSKYHWTEGMKFAHEGIKTLFLLNGAATVSILTFIGNTRTDATNLAYPLICYAFGAATGPLAFLFAYLPNCNTAMVIAARRSSTTAFI